MGEQGDVDGIVRAGLVASLDGALELFIPRPLRSQINKRARGCPEDELTAIRMFVVVFSPSCVG